MSEFRATFRAAQEGDQVAVELLTKIALEGDKEAEFVLMEEIRKAQLTSDFRFAEAFRRVTDANPTLHRAYLNCNGSKW